MKKQSWPARIRCAIYTRVSTNIRLERDSTHWMCSTTVAEASLGSPARESWRVNPDPL